MIKRWKPLKVQGSDAPFHLFQDNHVGFYMYITANYQSLLQRGEAGEGGSRGGEEERVTPA